MFLSGCGARSEQLLTVTREELFLIFQSNLTKNNEQSKFHARQLPQRQGPTQQAKCCLH